MVPRAVKTLVIAESALILGGLLFVGGAAAGLALPRLNPAAGSALSDWVTRPLPSSWTAGTPTPQAASTGSTDLQTLFRPFWQAWDIVHNEFVDRPVDDTLLMEGAVRGMIAALGDKHSSYMDPTEYNQANISLEGSYEGIGAWVDTESNYLTIISPMPGSPAEAAGLQAGDQVVAVDGTDMTGVPPQLVIRRVMGPEGTTVVLTVRREGVADPFDVQVQRGKITVPSVESRTLDHDIAYIRLSTFGDNTVGDLREALRTALAKNPPGLILDLRGNGGGYLSAAVDVASEFVPDGVILTERFGDAHEQVYQAEGEGLAFDIPLVVLVDGGSASASEIVAGAIQDHGRGQLVGETTYGKGSVQNWHPLDDQSGAVRVTIARWFTPNGRSIEDGGLHPDVEVPLTDQDVNAGRDPQLDRAVELLSPPSPAATPSAGALPSPQATSGG
ncbi:MAG TPA: S41 family peptidase [Anaerolineales bacterium]|nr:S41 family peptidase [Anaerolineales bacterium]